MSPPCSAIPTHSYVNLETGAPRGQTSEFREDIALLRAVAIISVLGYHFWPTILPMGYLGVDIFFVISGYLIMMILERSTGTPFNILIDFYYRRLKRIFPLYYLVVFCTGVLILFVYPTIWIKKYFSNYLSTILLYFNIQMAAGEESYFADITEDIPFLHLWTLSVEIQFYSVAPIIFYLSTLEKFRIGLFILPIIFCSSAFFAITSPSVQAFYHPISRLSQFATGMFASKYSKKLVSWADQHKSVEKFVDLFAGTVLSVILTTIFIPFRQAALPPNLEQLVITIACGIFMFLGALCSINWSMFRLGWMGTLSYSLYLTHYPILRFSKYLAKYRDINFDVLIPTLILVFIVSAILRNFYEKVFLQETRAHVLQEVSKYFILALLLQWKWATVVHPDLIMKTAVADNAKYTQSYFIVKDGEYVKDAWGEPGGFGHYRYKNGTGTNRVVIVGNSWAAQQAFIVREILPDSYVSTMDFFSWGSVAIPFDYLDKQSAVFWEYIETTKPQIVFILMRWVKALGHVSPFLGRENDDLLKRMLNATRTLSMHVDYIFLEGHQPACPEDNYQFLASFIDLLEKEADLTQANRNFDETEWNNNPVNSRLKIVLEECPKCHLIKIDEPFIDHSHNKVWMYDPVTQVSFIDNICHLTIPGFEKIKRSFNEAISSALNITTQN